MAVNIGGSGGMRRNQSAPALVGLGGVVGGAGTPNVQTMAHSMAGDVPSFFESLDIRNLSSPQFSGKMNDMLTIMADKLPDNKNNVDYKELQALEHGFSVAVSSEPKDPALISDLATGFLRKFNELNTSDGPDMQGAAGVIRRTQSASALDGFVGGGAAAAESLQTTGQPMQILNPPSVAKPTPPDEYLPEFTKKLVISIMQSLAQMGNINIDHELGAAVITLAKTIAQIKSDMGIPVDTRVAAAVDTFSTTISASPEERARLQVVISSGAARTPA